MRVVRVWMSLPEKLKAESVWLPLPEKLKSVATLHFEKKIKSCQYKYVPGSLVSLVIVWLVRSVS